MRMIPSAANPGTPSAGERTLFAALGAANPPGAWSALHALPIAIHPSKQESEIDFILAGPTGLFVLEVKGGGIRRQDGVWFSTNRHGQVHQLRESPFAQASSNAYALMNWLRDQLAWGEMRDLTVGHGVAFPDCDFAVESLSWSLETVLDQAKLHQEAGVTRYLDALAAYWHGKFPAKPAHVSPELIERVVRLLVPDIDDLLRIVPDPCDPAPPIVITRTGAESVSTTHDTKPNRFVTVRQEIVDYVVRDLVGPLRGEQERLRQRPSVRYAAGILYPQDAPLDETVGDGDDAGNQPDQPGAARNGNDDQSERTLEFANLRYPASLGLSFVVRGAPEIEVSVRAGVYARGGGEGDREDATEQREPGWQRRPLQAPDLDQGAAFTLRPGPDRRGTRTAVLEDRAWLTATWRPMGQDTLVTVTLINAKTGSSGDDVTNPADCLFQVEITCSPTSHSTIAAYPRTSLLTNDPEEHELELLYRRQAQFAVGHGCSVTWDLAADGSAAVVRTASVPSHDVPPIDYQHGGEADVLRYAFLSNRSDVDDDTLIVALRGFVADYAAWAEALPAAHPDIPGSLTSARDRLLGRLAATVARLQAGVELLAADPVARRAFRLANHAMLLQLAHAGPDHGGSARPNGTPYQPPNLQHFADRRWRPFQLAFQLLSLASLTDPAHPDRDLVDLIWFPTGGGKTEAYLAVTAFLIFHRRLATPQTAGGTAAIMRYTLRLLTTQQFRRAATMIAACEFMRRQNPEELTTHPITIGLWIGGDTTPNRYAHALREYERILTGDEPQNPFQIDACPWCGTWLIPPRKSLNHADYGVTATNHRFALNCPNQTCPFYTHLPIGVVDEQLYDAPPTLLLGTVDKFANLPWVEKSGVFFGDGPHRPPDLIIQDELHLIAGPLGTMVGLYETAVDGLIQARGARPKVIASTATIRQSAAQVNGLYHRPVHLFPPSGLTADDSYFASADPTRPGRLYVGVMTPGLPDAMAMIRLAAALLQAPPALDLHGDEREAYWTLVSYHNNLRGVGKGLSHAADDIPQRIKLLAAEGSDPASSVPLPARDIDGAFRELTSNVQSSGLLALLNQLNRPASDEHAISLLFCTNMLSVGVDIPRLALMMMNGQPKSTSEYIQATSRVGRSEVPGLVFCRYSAQQPRDRSHYERFVGFHQALYREVEPASVTPFARPARDRALHAVLVSLIRHGAGLAAAYNLNLDDAQISKIKHFIAGRAAAIDPQEGAATEADLTALLAQWQTWNQAPGRLAYDTNALAVPALLRNVDQDAEIGWPTTRSMRNIDVISEVQVLRTPQ